MGVRTADERDQERGSAFLNIEIPNGWCNKQIERNEESKEVLLGAALVAKTAVAAQTSSDKSPTNGSRVDAFCTSASV